MPFYKGFAGPNISIVDYNKDKQCADSRAAADACHINSANSSGLILDDLTYWVFQKSRYPMALTYLTGMGTDWDQIRSVLASERSSGIIVRCDYLASIPAFNRFMTRRGNICCIPPSSLNDLPVPW